MLHLLKILPFTITGVTLSCLCICSVEMQDVKRKKERKKQKEEGNQGATKINK
jgi:hypothetical protein